MALLGNYTVLAKNPGRAFSGSTISDNRSQSGKSGANRCRFAGWASYSSLSATPRGYVHPGAWVWPIDGGDMAAVNQLFGTGTLAGAGARGLNATAALTGSADLVGTGALIVSAVAALTATGTLSGDVVAVLQMAASLAAAGDVVGAMTAFGNAIASLAATGTMSEVASAIGHMEAAIVPFTELSPQSLASAVWGAVAASSSDAGSMGEALNFAQIVLRNKTITDPSAGTVTVYDTDGTTVLYVADLFQDAAGVTAYAGAGAERRERLE